MSYIPATFLGTFYLGERVGPLCWLGTILIVSGTVLIGISACRSRPAAPSDATERNQDRIGVRDSLKKDPLSRNDGRTDWGVTSEFCRRTDRRPFSGPLVACSTVGPNCAAEALYESLDSAG